VLPAPPSLRPRSEFIGAWRHVTSMLGGDAIRNDYATFLTSPLPATVRRATEALAVDLAAALWVSRSDDGARAFREQIRAVEGALRERGRGAALFFRSGALRRGARGAARAGIGA
jgi:hypothetical protein